jgi:hypothetical protein
MSILRKEKIVAAAVQTNGGLIISMPPPARHHTILQEHSKLSNWVFGSNKQGFLTNLGRYVGREEALKIALDAKQIEAPKFQPHHLFSEDLW